MLALHQNLLDVYEQYDAFFIDVYGVLYNGHEFYEGALDLLRFIKKTGKKVIILSNTTLLSDECKRSYGKKGLLQNVHYDEFISSGEAFRHHLDNINHKSYCQIFNKNNAIFENCELTEESSIEKAGFVYVGALNNDKKTYTADELKTKTGVKIDIHDMFNVHLHDIEGFEDISAYLNECLKHGKMLMVVNPDLFAFERIENISRPILCQGAVGAYYEQLGGETSYFGKPYQQIFDFAKNFIDKEDRVAMVGDTPWTDILGGNMAGIDTILTLTGVSELCFKEAPDLPISIKIEKLLGEISKKMTHKTLLQHSQKPTHIIEKFAK